MLPNRPKAISNDRTRAAKTECIGPRRFYARSSYFQYFAGIRKCIPEKLFKKAFFESMKHSFIPVKHHRAKCASFDQAASSHVLSGIEMHQVRGAV
jgi:hypothetical protein